MDTVIPNLKSKHLIAELIILFVSMPLTLLLPIHPISKVALIVAAVAYVIYVSKRLEIVTKKELYTIPDQTTSWSIIFLRFLLLVGISLTYMLLFHPDSLFIVAKRNVVLLIGVSIFYSIFSVYPQEYLYRTYFYKRYGHLFNQRWVLIMVNAVLFSLAHIVFLNPLVLLITFVGGIVFSLTYQKTNSLMLTSIEHAIYGCWIFTVGMGEMLAFPMPQ